MAANGQLADSDPDNDDLTVFAVNGAIANLGHALTLSSGAILTARMAASHMTDFGGGTFAHVVKPGMQQGDPVHRLCNPCFQQRRKGYLQSHGFFHGREKIICDDCGKMFMLGAHR